MSDDQENNVVHILVHCNYYEKFTVDYVSNVKRRVVRKALDRMEPSDALQLLMQCTYAKRFSDEWWKCEEGEPCDCHDAAGNKIAPEACYECWVDENINYFDGWKTDKSYIESWNATSGSLISHVQNIVSKKN